MMDVHHLGGKKKKDACENQHLGNASVDIRRRRDDALATYSVQDVNHFLMKTSNSYIMRTILVVFKEMISLHFSASA